MKKLTITIAIILLSIAAQSQLKTGWSSARVQLLIGAPDHVEQISPDTIQRTYNNDRIWLWFVNNEVVREIYILHSLHYRKDTRRLKRKPEPIPGWRLVQEGIICRTLIWNGETCIECKSLPEEIKPKNIRVNPVVEQ